MWPWNLTDDLGKQKGHIFYATSSFAHHFVAIGEFKLELQSGNAQFQHHNLYSHNYHEVIVVHGISYDYNMLTPEDSIMYKLYHVLIHEEIAYFGQNLLF